MLRHTIVHPQAALVSQRHWVGRLDTALSERFGAGIAAHTTYEGKAHSYVTSFDEDWTSPIGGPIEIALFVAGFMAAVGGESAH